MNSCRFVLATVILPDGLRGGARCRLWARTSLKGLELGIGKVVLAEVHVHGGQADEQGADDVAEVGCDERPERFGPQSASFHRAGL